MIQTSYDKALVVDDERFVLRTTASLLERLGVRQVLTAESAEAAIQLITSVEQPIGLVLSDLNMPGVDGVDLIRMFDEADYRGDLILFSGEDPQTLSMAESLARARKLSVLGSMAKPVSHATLEEMLKRPSLQHADKPVRPRPLISHEDVRAAIENAELAPWFQPKIDIASRQPVGVEVLARWPNGPAGGPVFPDEFIPVAEENGLIDKLTWLMVDKAVAFSNSWRDAGIQLKVALNVSMNSLQALDFPTEIERRIRDAGGASGDFEVEVTESRLATDVVLPLDVLLRLRLKRIGLSIDDFGTGHSNLAQLRDLPFDELKLDRSFVRGALYSGRTEIILQASVDLAKRLGMTVIAEGVETLEDWQRVSELGCDQVQGWFTAKPMPGEAIAKWYKGWAARVAQLFPGN